MSALKLTDTAIKAYHAALKTFAEHKATHEGATETAFSHLLAVTAAFGFTTHAMVFPLVTEFDGALGRTTAPMEE